MFCPLWPPDECFTGEYLAICRGHITPSAGTIHAPLSRKARLHHRAHCRLGAGRDSHHPLSRRRGKERTQSRLTFAWRLAAPIKYAFHMKHLAIRSLGIICIILTWNISGDRRCIPISFHSLIQLPERRWNSLRRCPRTCNRCWIPKP